ncbi:MAG: hypothetical protein ACKVOM_05260 [Ferruginibacter sp.]
MKNFIVLCFFSTLTLAAFSQDGSHILKIDKYFKLPGFPKIKTPSYLKKYNVTGKDNRIIGKRDNLLVLPLDNMPCFVPDVSRVAKMPNQHAIGVAIPIPNSIIPSK